MDIGKLDDSAFFQKHRTTLHFYQVFVRKRHEMMLFYASFVDIVLG